MSGGAEESEIVITGIGMITPFGDRNATWDRIRNGSRAVGWVDESESGVPFDGPTVGAKAVLPAEVRFVRTGEPVVDLALQAAGDACEDAGLMGNGIPPERIGCVIGSSKGGLLSLERAFRGVDVAANWIGFLPATPAATVSRTFQLRGPALCPVVACATGVVCLQRGYELIRDGYCDVVLAGSSDASLLPAVAASYRRLGVIASNFQDPATACRPFDRSRSGFAIGEGAAVLVLERALHAARRGAAPYARWAAGGTAGEAHDITRLGNDPSTLVRLLRDVVSRSGARFAEIDYCNLHGTATLPNDVYETAGLKAAFGTDAAGLSCSSLKGAIGHLLGAAGSVETAITLLALRDGIVPPTMNLTDPDPKCDLDYTPGRARPKTIRTALKLSLGFGGHLAAAVLCAE